MAGRPRPAEARSRPGRGFWSHGNALTILGTGYALPEVPARNAIIARRFSAVGVQGPLCFRPLDCFAQLAMTAFQDYPGSYAGSG